MDASPHNPHHYHHTSNHPTLQDDYPSSSDEANNDRIHRTRLCHANTNLERVRRALAPSASSPTTATDSESSGFSSSEREQRAEGSEGTAEQQRALTAALMIINTHPAIRAQLRRIEEVWTVRKDKPLADALYTEVVLAIVLSAGAIVGVGREGDEEGDGNVEEGCAEEEGSSEGEGEEDGEFSWECRGAEVEERRRRRRREREQRREIARMRRAARSGTVGVYRWSEVGAAQAERRGRRERGEALKVLS